MFAVNAPLLSLLLLLLTRDAVARVVINEVLYNAPDELEDLEYIELHNSGDREVDLSGWTISEGVEFRFEPGARIEPRGFVVLCRSRERFQEFYDAAVAGVFSGQLRNGGDRLELRDASGSLKDALRYKDSPPWPMGSDGYSGSLERISPEADGGDPSNWVSSTLSPDRVKPAGTPGKVNGCYSAELPPVISEVKLAPEHLAPGEELRVEARVRGKGEPGAVNLLYRLAGPGFEKPEVSVPMQRTEGDRYQAVVPGQAAQQLIRVRIEALGKSGARRSFPAETEPRPALSSYVSDPIEPARIPFAWIIHTDEPAFRTAQQGAPRRGRRGPGFGGPRRFGGPPDTGGAPEFGGPPGFGPRGRFGGRAEALPSAGSSRSAFVYFDPDARKLRLFDFVQVVPRAGGYKVKFHKDAPLDRMTVINLTFDNERAVLAEPLAYEVYRRAGMAAPQSYHVRLWLDGRPLGYHALIEQPTRAFLRRHGLDGDGNLYKIIWFERGIVEQHEKKTNTRSGHEDIVHLIEALERTRGAEQWELIRASFDVDGLATYFAVSMAISNWDGFFNNYFTYHDTGGTGKWTMYPWDQDQTWGISGPSRSGEFFHDMPLTFGMEGDIPPGGDGRRRGGRGFGFGGGGPGWWRPGGPFSRPLLANREFRKVFLARTKELLEKVYTEEVFGPLIDAMRKRLEPEVELRAGLLQMDAESALGDLALDLEGFREHVRVRREFLLAQEELGGEARPPGSGEKTDAGR